jgi:MYXO-CTERM domain-containing protein
MLKAILLFSFTIATASAIPIVGPISVTGGGSQYFSLGDGGVTQNFSGTNGTDSVSVFGSGELGPDGSAGYGNANGSFVFSGEAQIDSFSSDYFEFGVGGGSGSLTLYTSAEVPIITAELIGYVTITSFSYLPPCCLSGYTETFAITPTPEPSSGWLGLIGIVALAARRYVVS